MEQNNPNLPTCGSHCRSGCGFYGNDAFEGYCSKCYKGMIKRKQSSSPVGSAGRASPSVGSCSSPASGSGSSPSEQSAVMNSVSQTLAMTSIGSQQEGGSNSSSSASLSSASTTPSIETATPTIQVPGVNKDKEEEGATGGADVGETTGTSSDSGKDKKKKNRCHTCKKKVGLTGFQCRCGGLYCSLHRYSDKHDCTFNYKEMAQEQIRKNNPVIVGEKVQKI